MAGRAHGPRRAPAPARLWFGRFCSLVWRAMTSPTSRPPLTRETVVAATRELIEDEGLEAVSFRRLAQRLGVTAPALYAYVSDKDDLLRSVTIGELMAIVGG